MIGARNVRRVAGCIAAGICVAFAPTTAPGRAHAATALGAVGLDVAISGDGRVVAVVTAEALAAEDTNTLDDVYVLAVGGEPQLASLGPDGAGNGASTEPTVNYDGTVVAFTSRASNLHPLDRDTGADVYARDRTAGRTELVSLAANMWVGDARSHSPSLSANGAYVAFVSAASNLAGLPPGGPEVVHVMARATRTVEVVGVGTGGQAWHPRLSADGSAVAFLSTATGLAGDPDPARDAFLTLLGGGGTTLLTPGAASVPDGEEAAPAVSAAGDVVAFVTLASLHPADTDSLADVYLQTRGGAPSLAVEGDGATVAPALSADGTMVVLIGGTGAQETAAREAIAIGPGGATVLSEDVGGPPATSSSAAQTAYPDSTGRLVLADGPGAGAGVVAGQMSPTSTAFSARLDVHLFGAGAASVGVDIDANGLADQSAPPPGGFTIEASSPRRLAIHAVDGAGTTFAGWVVPAERLASASAFETSASSVGDPS